MSDTYRGVLVVVVAAMAESPQNSLLTVKPQSGQSHTWRTTSLKGYEELDLNVKFRERLYYAHCSTNSTNETYTGRRAWCFQEKLLASRCLVFHDEEVIWECRSCCLCECSGEQEQFPVGNETGMRRYQQMLLPLADETLTAFAQLPFAQHNPLQLDCTPKYFANAEEAYSFWETAVENYSERALSVETDRLPAISAVASVVAEATGDRYLAGLWRNDLLAGLAWTAQYTKAGHHQGYIAPTWSWASHEGPALYPDKTRRHWRGADQAKVVDASTDLKEFGQSMGLHGPMSEVADGAIVLSGVHCDVEMSVLDDGVQYNFENGEVETVRGYGSSTTSRFLDLTPVEQLRGNSRYLRRVRGTPRYERAQPACSGTVRLLWLKEEISLILTPSLKKEGAYMRDWEFSTQS